MTAARVRIAAIIPAHLASVRFPRKILFPFHGLPMIEHVRRRALLCDSIHSVSVATCDPEIAEMVGQHGGDVIMTGTSHTNGTTRVAEAAAGLDCTHVMLIQGDEPLLLPRHLEACAQAVVERPQADVWNATGPIQSSEELDRHSFVKCSVGLEDRIVQCFRRSPFFSRLEVQRAFVRKILGIIVFRKNFLDEFAAWPPSPIEQAELIEQMRIIEYGRTLVSVPVAPSLPSVNEPGEAHIVLDYVAKDEEQRDFLAQVLSFG